MHRNTNLIISPKVENIIKFKSVDEFTLAVDQLVTDNPNRTFFVTPLLLRDSIVAGTNKGNYHTSKYSLIPHGLLLQVIDKKSLIKPNETLVNNFPAFEKTPFYMERIYNNAYKLLRNDYAVAYAQLGDYYQLQNNNKQAEQFFQKAIEQGMTNTPEFTQRLAIFYAQIGQNDLARKYFQTSLARDPDNPALKQNLQIFLGQTASSSANIPADSSSKISGNSTGQFKSKSGLKFDYPKDWRVEEKNQEIFISDPAGTFSIQIAKAIRQSDVGIEEYLSQQKTSLGQLLEQGLAKIPNTDLAYVRVWSNNSKSKLEFFLFKSNVVLHIIVGPSDSPQMKLFDAIITSIKL